MNRLRQPEEKTTKAKHAKLRADAESRLDSGSASETLPRRPDDVRHELQVHQIELEMQNESLRETQFELEESRDRYRDLYEFSPVGYLTLAHDGLISEINLTACTLLGRVRSQLLHRLFASLIADEDRDRWRQHFVHNLLRGETPRMEIALKHIDGTLIRVRLDCLSTTTNNEPSSLRIALTDISAQSRAEQELRIAAIAFESQQGMMVTDSAGIILRVNSAFTRRTGYSAREIIGKTPALLKSGRHDQLFYQRMWATLNEQGNWHGPIWNRHRNGEFYVQWVTLAAVTAPDGLVSHYVGTYSNIAENTEAEAEIHRLAYYDPLTNLPNRRLLLDRLGQALASSARSGRYGAVLYLDLDHFKSLNDTHGHDAGDLLLKIVAQRLASCIRKENTIARLSGDEFVVVLADLSADAGEASHQAGQIAEKLSESLSRPCDLEGPEYRCTVSVGIALFHGHDKDVTPLLRQADLALYQAKKAGRNTQRFFDATMQVSQDQYSALKDDLRQALERRQLRLYFQPQVDRSRRVTGVEALLRWDHPEHGLLKPDAFIPLAEETGLILPIGRWVLAAACAQIKAWSERAGAETLMLAVNVSAREFRQKGFVTDLEKTLSASGADPTHLRLELTESLVITDLQDTIAKMQAVTALGVTFAMDDFGTGYSSLSALSSLPLNQLKIDQSFIRKLDTDRDTNNAIVTQSIIALGHTLGLHVVAEGVETETQLDFLERHGCQTYQGNLFSEPLPLEGFEKAYLQTLPDMIGAVSSTA